MLTRASVDGVKIGNKVNTITNTRIPIPKYRNLGFRQFWTQQQELGHPPPPPQPFPVVLDSGTKVEKHTYSQSPAPSPPPKKNWEFGI